MREFIGAKHPYFPIYENQLDFWSKQKQQFASDLQNRCPLKLFNIHRKTPVLISLKTCGFLKKRLQHKCFPLHFKFLRIPFSQNTSIPL